MADKTYIQFTGRLKATSQEGILAEAQQIAISGSDNTNVKKYIDDKISSVNNNIGSVAGSVYRPKGSITFAGLKALTSATAGDVYNVTDAFTLGSKSYPAGSNVACLKSFSSAVTPDETYWDVLAGFVDLSPYAKTSEVNTIKGNLEKSISDNVSTLTSKVGTAQATANEASSAASTNAGEITKVKNRVSSLEGVGAQANVIESVKVNGSALPVSNKSVNVDLSAYAETTELDKRINLKSESGDNKSVSIFNGAVRLYLGTNVEKEQIFIGEGVTIGSGVNLYKESDGRLKIGNGIGQISIANLRDLDSYVQKESGKVLSSNDYTSAEKTKLAGIASSAQVNVIESVKVNGSALPVSNKSVNVDLSAYAQTTELDKRINLNIESGDKKSVSIFGGAVRLSLGTDADVQQIDIQEDVVIGSGVKVYRESDGRLKFLSGRGDFRIANLEDLNGYVQKESGKGLSSNDYTSAEKTKLAGIASSAQVNVIESVKVNGSALAVANKAVDIDLSSYAKGSDVNSLKTKTKKFVVLPFTFGLEIGTPTFEQSSITLTGEATVYYSKAGKTFYVVSNMKNYSSWANAAGHPGNVEYNDENILFIETSTKELYMKTADGLVLCNQSLVSGYATTSALKAAENRITALENLLKLA